MNANSTHPVPGRRLVQWPAFAGPSKAGVMASGVALLLLAATLIGARLWPSSLLALAATGTAFAAFAASRWPRATLVVACLATLADPVLVRRALPPDIALGPIGASEPILAVTCLVIAVHAIRRRSFLTAFRDPVFTLSAMFVMAAAVSAIVSRVPAPVALLGIVMTVDAIAIYFVARMARFDDRSASIVLIALVAAAVTAASFGILQALLHPELLGFASFRGRFGEGGRITSFLGNPNMLAMIIGLALPFPVIAARRARAKVLRWLSWIAAYLLVVALLLTFSRGAWLAILIAMVIGTALLDRRALVTLALIAAFGVATVSIMPRYVLLSPEEYARYFGSRGAPSLVDSTVTRVTQQRDLRLRFVREGLPILQDHPWLGVGPGRYGGAAASIVESPVYEEYGTGLYGFRTVHNFWLHLVGEVGVIGGAIFLTMLIGLGLRLLGAARSARAGPSERSTRFIVVGGAAMMLLTVSLHSATEMVLEGNIPSVLIWLVLGMAAALTAPQGLLGERAAGRNGEREASA